MFAQQFHSPLGLLQIKATDTALLEILFVDEPDLSDKELPEVPNDITQLTALQLQEYFNGNRQDFDIPLAPAGTEFQQKVWQALTKIPFGKTTSYSAIANDLSNPLSVRAVGMANGKNPIAIIIPCHRVIGANGSLTGYAGGLWRKEKLLILEGNSGYTQPRLWEE